MFLPLIGCAEEMRTPGISVGGAKAAATAEGADRNLTEAPPPPAFSKPEPEEGLNLVTELHPTSFEHYELVRGLEGARSLDPDQKKIDGRSFNCSAPSAHSLVSHRAATQQLQMFLKEGAA